MSIPGLILFLLVLAIVVLLLRAVIHIVPEYQRLVVFRLGKCIGHRGPGLVLLIPVVDRPVTVDLRERFLEIPKQTSITKDNAPIGIDFLVYSRVEDPVNSVVRITDFSSAVIGLATTNLRAVVGDLTLDDVLARRDYINQTLADKLDEVTEGWGVKVTRVEIREITPPADVQEAMVRQMSAERARRAMITEAEGQKQAAVTVAEGEKQAAILRAEGAKQSQILAAQGLATALEAIYGVARSVDANTMTLEYLDVLRSMAQGQGTKFVIPMEFTRLLEPLLGGGRGAGSDGVPRAGGS
ncbi:MAG: SPFH domain-containing protein [Bacillota bacterium]|nr:SPFH domain-containing protein [Bacillota bacterium]